MFTLWHNIVLFSVPLDNIMKIEIYFLSWAYIIIIGDFFILYHLSNKTTHL